MVSSEDSVDYDALRRRVRLLMLLEGCEKAGLTPVRLRHLHTYAYLSNVLAPVWNARVFDGHLLKQRTGPFYPSLQRDLDRLVGSGLVLVTDLGHVTDAEGRWRLDGEFSLNYELASAALSAIDQFPQERILQSFLTEMAYAISALTGPQFDRLTEEDPTYSDPNVAYENVVDFADWKEINYSSNAAKHFASLLSLATPGEMLHLFVRHLRRRLRGPE